MYSIVHMSLACISFVKTRKKKNNPFRMLFWTTSMRAKRTTVQSVHRACREILNKVYTVYSTQIYRTERHQKHECVSISISIPTHYSIFFLKYFVNDANINKFNLKILFQSKTITYCTIKMGIDTHPLKALQRNHQEEIRNMNVNNSQLYFLGQRHCVFTNSYAEFFPQKKDQKATKRVKNLRS